MVTNLPPSGSFWQLRISEAASPELFDLAHLMADQLEDGAELSTGLRKLIEAKDCLVRQRVIDLKPVTTVNTPEDFLTRSDDAGS